MWIDPLVKWRQGELSPGAAELLAGRASEARAHFEEAGDLVGAGDALLALGSVEEAVKCFSQATGDDRTVECGRSQALVLLGDPQSAVRRLESLSARLPDDPVVRHHLTGALLEVADQVRSVTRDEEHVITSRAQFDVCAQVAQRAEMVAVDENHRAGIRALQAELARGERWIWSSGGAALGYCLLAAVAGLAIVGLGGAMENILLVVAGALAGAAAIYAIVRGFRRQAWQVRATDVAPMVWRHGLR